MKGRVCVSYMVVALLIVCSSSAWSARGDLIKSFSFGGSKLTMDYSSHRLYAANPQQNRLEVIDTRSMSHIASVPVGASPRVAAVSPDGTRVYVANTGDSTISVVDASSFAVLNTFRTQFSPWDLEVGLEDRLYVTTQGYQDNWWGFLQIDGNTGEARDVTNDQRWMYRRGFVEISQDRTLLYFGNSGLSPATLSKYDVSTPTMVGLGGNQSMGSNGMELTLSHDGKMIYYGLGGSFGYGYWLGQLRTSDFGLQGTLDAGQSDSIALSPTDSYLYRVHFWGAGGVDIYSLSNYQKIGGFAIGTSHAGDIVIDETGTRLFASFVDRINVFDTGFAPIPEPSTILALLCGLGGMIWRKRK